MPGAPANRYRSPKGRPPNDPHCSADNVLRQLRDDKTLAANPVLACVLGALNSHWGRKFAETTAYLEAAAALLESCQQAAAQDADIDPLELCDCGHARCRHTDGNYCVSCLYQLNGTGWYGCKAFHQATLTPDVGILCMCGRMRMTNKPQAVDPDYPRVHVKDRSKSCYELVNEGPSRRPIRVALKPVEREL